MSTPEIIRKLSEELDKGITTEVQVVYVLAAVFYGGIFPSDTCSQKCSNSPPRRADQLTVAHTSAESLNAYQFRALGKTNDRR